MFRDLTIYHASRLVDGAHCLATPQGNGRWLTLDDDGQRCLLSSSALSLGGNIALCESSEEMARLTALMQAALNNPAVPHLYGPRPEPTVLTTPYNPRCDACDTVRGIGQRCPQHAQPEAQGPVPAPLPASFSAAPAAVNVHLIIDGRPCQVTLSDTDETRLMARLHAFLAAHPLPSRT